MLACGAASLGLHVRPNAFGNALGESLAKGSSLEADQQRSGREEAAIEKEQWAAKAQGEGAVAGSGIRFGGSSGGMRLSADAVDQWSRQTDTAIANEAEQMARKERFLDMHPTADASDVINREMQRFAGTAKGALQFVANGVNFVNDQGWTAANFVTGGWLANNNDAARASVDRNNALGSGLLTLPEKASGLALRTLTGNITYDEVSQGVGRAMRTDQMAALEARGDYAGAAAIRAENALNIASLGISAAPAARSALSLAGSVGETTLMGTRLAVESFAGSSTGQGLALRMERFNYETGFGASYAVEPNFSLGEAAQAMQATQRTVTARDFNYVLSKDNGILSTLSKEGIVDFKINAVGSPVRGTVMFDKMMGAYGEDVAAIRGNWMNRDAGSSNKNLGVINELTSKGVALEDAVTKTWTAQQAARYGFTKPTVQVVIGEPGNFTKIETLFHKP